ncbi:MAG: septal ring lytic transglycosylase RlpA family protein [Bacteroidota bacterium]
MQLTSFAVIIILGLFVSPVQNGAYEKGKASYYADKFKGKPTASGAKYMPNKLTAAHKKLPFGTVVKVTNLKNGKSVKVTINDRGPFVKGRIIDLSKAAAKKIDLIKDGVVDVEIRVLQQ